jgi:hypothetical protein
MSAHIIGRPNDDVLDIMLGQGADPEQAFIRGSEQGREEGDGFEEHAAGGRRQRPREGVSVPVDLPDIARIT